MVYYNSECAAYILPFGNVVNTCESVVYDRNKDCYIVQTSKNGYCYKFSRDAYGNFFCDLDTMVTTNKTLLGTIVSEKKKKYLARQIRHADLAGA
jgi:hypothetical protein